MAKMFSDPSQIPSNWNVNDKPTNVTGISETMVDFKDPRVQRAVNDGQIFADPSGNSLQRAGGLNSQPPTDVGYGTSVRQASGGGGMDLLERKKNALQNLLKKYE